jgi:moderate conductance mechanosensitive channel
VSLAVLPPLSAVTPTQLRDTCGEDPGFFCRVVYEWTEDRDMAELADKALGATLTAIAILLVAYVLNKLVSRAVRRALRTLHSGPVHERLGSLRRRTPAALLEPGDVSLRAEQRINALTSVMRSVATAVIFTIAIFLIIGEFGVNLAPLLAGAGIVGIALGFGAQSLVKDFLSGVFILVEDQFGVGDIVDLDQQTSGTVEAVSLRTTRLRAVDGTVWHVPNGDIRRVGNKSQHWSRALLDVEVAYDTDIDLAKGVIKRVADALWKEREDILEEPEVWGVERLGPNAIVIRLVVKTRPADQYDVSRELRQRLKEAFDAEGIEIPFPQQVVWNRNVPAPAPAAEEGR